VLTFAKEADRLHLNSYHGFTEGDETIKSGLLPSPASPEVSDQMEIDMKCSPKEVCDIDNDEEGEIHYGSQNSFTIKRHISRSKTSSFSLHSSSSNLT